jgi:hypothetical protein
LSASCVTASASAAASPGEITTPPPWRSLIAATSDEASTAAMYGRPAARMGYNLLGTM